MSDQSVIETYQRLCEELSLSYDERRRLWFAISAEIARVEAELHDSRRATTDEIEAVCKRLGVPSIRVLAMRVRLPPAARGKPANRTLEDWPDDPREVLVRYWNDIHKIVSQSRERLNADEEEADTVESRVKEQLFANECEIVRAFRHESSFASYLRTIIQRTFSNLRVERSGKWHYSAMAERLGPLAKQLERLIYLDAYSSSDAISVLLTSNPEATRAELETIAESLPARQPRPSKVAGDPATQSLRAEEADVLTFSGERLRLSRTAAAVVQHFMEQLADNDRLLMQFLFEHGLRMPKIAEILQQQQKRLYRQRDTLFKQLRSELENAGIGPAEAADLYESIAKHTVFSFAKRSR